jgi:hypothetical protein
MHRRATAPVAYPASHFVGEGAEFAMKIGTEILAWRSLE